VQPDKWDVAIQNLTKIIEKNEQKLAYFQNRLKQAQFIDRPNRRMVGAAEGQADSYADQLQNLWSQLRELEQLRGGSVKLRTTEERDLRRIWCWLNDATMHEALRAEPLLFQAYVDNWHRWLADDDTQPFSIDLSTGELIGSMLINYTGRAWEARCASLEFIIIRPGLRYRGYGTEATRHAMDLSFEQFDADSFVLQVDVDNHAALKCFEKSGLQCVATESGSSRGDGVNSDRYSMELYHEQWGKTASMNAGVTDENEYSARVVEPNTYGAILFAPLKELVSNR
jgi:RimJ/RimL family protein N-acetyltransferase